MPVEIKELVIRVVVGDDDVVVDGERARRHVVDGKNLQQPETGGAQPWRETGEVGDVADTPAPCRASREQGKQEAGATAE